VYFGVDRSGLDVGMQSALNEQAAWLNRYQNYRVRVIGHAADEGVDGGTSRQYALGLSERRASAVRDYLTSVGVDPSRIETIGMGRERPLAQGASAEANARNRHVQVVPYLP
jgi:peptidoglycan-associated lipoprotein